MIKRFLSIFVGLASIVACSTGSSGNPGAATSGDSGQAPQSVASNPIDPHCPTGQLTDKGLSNPCVENAKCNLTLHQPNCSGAVIATYRDCLCMTSEWVCDCGGSPCPLTGTDCDGGVDLGLTDAGLGGG